MLLEFPPCNEFAKRLGDAIFVPNLFEEPLILLCKVSVERTRLLPTGRVPKLVDREKFLRLEVLPQEIECRPLRGVAGHWTYLHVLPSRMTNLKEKIAQRYLYLSKVTLVPTWSKA
jgi:hypothetical protein